MTIEELIECEKRYEEALEEGFNAGIDAAVEQVVDRPCYILDLPDTLKELKK